MLAIFRFDFSQSSPLVGLQCALSIGLPLLVGITSGHARAGGWGAVGAFLTDMAILQPGHRFRARIVAGTAVLVALGSFLGALIGIRGIGIYPLVGIWTFSAGLCVAISPTAALIGVSSATAIVYAASLDVSAGLAVQVGVVIVMSGLAATAIAYGVGLLVDHHTKEHASGPPPASMRRWTRDAVRSVQRSLTPSSPALHHALRLTVGALVGTLLFRVIDPIDGFWIPEAVLFIMRPDPELTKQRSALRVLGSIAGVTLTTLLLTTLRPSLDLMAVIAVGASAIAFSVQRVNFGLYITFVTCIFVFLTAFGGLPPQSAVVGRLVDNLIGSGIAVAALWIWPVHPTTSSAGVTVTPAG